ncbi:MAG: fumarate hydratase, partial [Candidatus Latescibacteria bacterium]|nr:fumarate hydratase [Candidatus Latescibacterota bacterium]
MRTISCQEITDKVAQLVADTNYYLPDDVLNEIIRFRARETENLPISILDQIIENARIASEEQLPLCQDTGIAVFFVEIGIGVYVDGPGIEDAINEGVRRGHRDGGLRMSIVGDPLKRGNTGDNTPAVVHYTIVPGDSLNIMFCPKGGGCENMSRTAMLDPGDGREGVVDFVVDTVRIAGGKPCPPVIVGVG